jgi:5'-3' exonuclease
VARILKSDNSSVWHRVFKNIFEQTKFVESYRSSDIETELHLDRKKLIFLAHLLGSDYAAGVHGIGADKSTSLRISVTVKS